MSPEVAFASPTSVVAFFEFPRDCKPADLNNLTRHTTPQAVNRTGTTACLTRRRLRTPSEPASGPRETEKQDVAVRVIEFESTQTVMQEATKPGRLAPKFLAAGVKL